MSRTRVAGAVWGTSLILVGAWAVIFAVPGGTVFYPYGVPMIGLGLLFSTFGVLILRRRPGNRVGWLFLALGSAGSVALVLGQASIALAPSPTSGALMLVSESFRLVAFLGLSFLVLIYPTGHAPSRRWRWVGRALALGLFLIVLATVVRPGPVLGTEWKQQVILDITNPIAFDSRALVTAVESLSLIAFVGFVGVVASIVFRYRATRAVERQQIKLFALAAVGCFVVLLGANLLLPKQMEGPLGEVLWNAPVVVLPAAATAAILRHGLYDIDRIISRTVSYALVTGLLLGTYAGMALLLQLATRPLVGTSDLAVAASVLIVAAAFRPVRRRVQGVVDRRFNRARYDAVRTIETFSARLREETQIETLESDLREIVRQTMHPSHVTLWMRAR